MIRKQHTPTEYAAGRTLPALQAMEQKLKAQDRGGLWQSIDEVLHGPAGARTADVHADSDGEGNGVARRDFMKLMGAGMSLAGLTACTRQPEEKIVPYVDAPEEIIPGKPLFYATGMVHDGFSVPVLAESHMGRPTKLEPNPDHPGAGTGSSVFAQAAVRDLWDPDRSTKVMQNGRLGSWKTWEAFAAAKAEQFGKSAGKGLAILVEPTSSPTLIDQLEWVQATYDEAKVYFHSSVDFEDTLAATEQALGQPLWPVYDLTKASEIVVFDADPLGCDPGSLVYSRDWGAGRDLVDHPESMNRLMVFESQYSTTGAASDHRLGVASHRIGIVLGQVAKGLGLSVGEVAEANEAEQAYIDKVVGLLKAAKGASAVMVGHHQPAAVQALGIAINSALGNIGKTVEFIESPVRGWAGMAAGREELVASMKAGSVDTLMMLGTNPVYDFPVELDFRGALENVAHRVHAGTYYDETGLISHWHLPLSHFLESWNDARTTEGTTTLAQPLIAPIYQSRGILDLLAPFADMAGKNAHKVLQTFHQENATFTDFDRFWRKGLHDGYVAGTAFSPESVSLKPEAHTGFTATAPALSVENLEVVFRPDPTIHDGRYANNAWLQETPKPVTTLTWDNAVIMSPTTAKALELLHSGAVQNRAHKWPKNAEVVVMLPDDSESGESRTVKGALLVVPGIADFSVILHLGYGRERGGDFAAGAGFNAGKIRRNAHRWHSVGATVKPTGTKGSLGLTQDHHTMAGRKEIVRYGSFDEFTHDPDFAAHYGHHFGDKYSVYPDFDYSIGHQWAKAIDLTRCTSCNACVVACASENNTAMVGKEEIMNGREMHWIRLDRYFGDASTKDKRQLDNLFSADVQVHGMPVACQHCEKAPCETVCPVGATVHSNEGINQMVYNRCVGTRYCSNNCPYKVRRFNWFQYIDQKSESLKGVRNPDVTPRVRGVMEKCTYCIQRINKARIDAKRDPARRVETTKDGKPRIDYWINDGEVVTACQQACPTNAISFGNLNDPEGEVPVKRFRNAPHSYALLDGYQTEPRTTYLARIRNSVKGLGPQKPVDPHGHGGGHGDSQDDHGKTTGDAPQAHGDSAHGEAH